MIISYVNEEGRVISDAQLEEMAKELAKKWEEDWFDDWLNENGYYASSIFFLKEEQKAEIWEKFQKACLEEAKWELTVIDGWSMCEIDW